MRPTPEYIDLVFLLLMFGILATLVVGHYVACQRAQLNDPSRRTIWLMVGILGWVMLLAFLASIGIFAQFDRLPPRLPLLLFAAMLTIVFLITRPVTKKLAAAVPLHWPLILQGFRVPLEFILWSLFINNALPEQMTFSGYNYDILSGIFGLILGFGLFKGWVKSKAVLMAYNILGLVLLATIVIIAILSIPTPFRYFMNEPANTIVAYVPYVWIPGVYVLMALFLHLFSIKQVLGDRNIK